MKTEEERQREEKCPYRGFDGKHLFSEDESEEVQVEGHSVIRCKECGHVFDEEEAAMSPYSSLDTQASAAGASEISGSHCGSL